MTPRFKLIIIIGIIAYVALSLYHWQLAGKFTGSSGMTSSSQVLNRSHQEKNWVQVSTTPSQTTKADQEPLPAETADKDPSESGEQQNNRTNPPFEYSRPAERQSSVAPESDLEQIRRQNEELRQTLRNEKSRLAGEIRELRSRLAQQQSELDETRIRLREKEERPSLSPQPGKEKPSESNNDMNTLQSLLGARLEALNKANERIRGLADLLDKTRDELLENRNKNALLLRQLTEAEIAGKEKAEATDRLKKDLDRTIAELENSLAESGRLQRKLQEKTSLLSRLENELRNVKLKSDAYYQYSREQTQLIDPFRQRIETLHARLGDQNSELLGAEDRIEKLNNDADQNRLEIQTLRLEKEKNRVIGNELQKTAAALEEEQQTSVQLRQQLKYLALELSRKNSELDLKENKLADTTENLQQIGQQYGDLQEQARQYQEQLATAQSRIDELQRQIEQKAAEQQKTQKHLQQTLAQNRSYQDRINELEPKLAEAAVRTEEMTAQLQEKDNQLTGTLQALEAAQTSLQKLEAADESGEQAEDDRARATEKIAALQASLAEAEKRLQEKETRIQEFRQTIARSEQRDQADTGRLNSLQAEIAKLRRNVADTEAALADREKTIARLQSENQQLQVRQEELDAKETDSEALQAELERRSKELASQKDQLGRLESQLQDLESKLAARENQLTAIQQDHAELEDKLTAMEAERESLLVYRRDSDNDSVSDAQDACPNTQPGVAVGTDGCEPDQDEDGIVDRLDLCIDSSAQADLNPFGCPADTPIILADLYFSSGTADLSPAARSYLDRVAAILQRSPETVFEVGGHTDSIGEPERNLTVSRQRAQAVADYLISKGIDAERLRPVGYGPANPVADNASPEGRRANRRVELKIMDYADNPPEQEQDQETSPPVQASATSAEKEGSPAR